jgi:hypothetical protein
MKQLFTLTAAPAAAFLALALAGISTPAAAAKYEYCRTDVSSAMRSCSFTSLEQCQATSEGRGGTCARDPFLPAENVSNAFAQQPRGGTITPSVRFNKHRPPASGAKHQPWPEILGHG